jgi:hypothetical protein
VGYRRIQDFESVLYGYFVAGNGDAKRRYSAIPDVMSLLGLTSGGRMKEISSYFFQTSPLKV